MGVTTVPVEIRRDGKIHPAGGRLRGAAWNRAVNLSHVLRCRDHLSYRQVVKALEQYGIRRSLGQAHADIANFECDHCAGQPAPPATESQNEPARAHQAFSGLLTGDLSDG